MVDGVSRQAATQNDVYGLEYELVQLMGDADGNNYTTKYSQIDH